MQDINRIVVVGRLTKDCGSDPNGRDFAYLQNGTCKAIVSIAVNRSKKQGDQYVEEASYFDVVIWGRTAENLKPYLTKGQQILVDGQLIQDRWEKDGQRQSKIYINSELVQLVGGKRDDNQNGYSQSQYAQQYNQQNGYQQGGAPRFQPARNGMEQVQQMAGQPIQTRQPQQMQPRNDGFKEDIPWNSNNDYPDIPF